MLHQDFLDLEEAQWEDDLVLIRIGLQKLPVAIVQFVEMMIQNLDILLLLCELL